MKKILLSILMALVAIFAIGCEDKTPTLQYYFPIDQNSADAVLQEVGLPWKAIEPTSFWKGHESYFIADEEGFYRASLDSTGTENIKQLSIIALRASIDANKSIQKQVDIKDEPKLVELAIKLFGEDIDGAKLYNEAKKETSKETVGNGLLYEKRIDDTYYSLNFIPSENKEIYYLRQIQVSNKVAYEAINDSYAEGWFSSISKHLKEKDVMKISEIAYEDCVARIDGTLTNLKKLDKNSKYSGIRIDGKEYIIDNEDYMKGTLTDDSGEVEVLVRKSALNKDDLKEQRLHLVYYMEENEIPIVELSIVEGSAKIWQEETRIPPS